MALVPVLLNVDILKFNLQEFLSYKLEYQMTI